MQYGHPFNMTTSATRPLVQYGHPCNTTTQATWSHMQYCHLCNTATSVIRQLVQYVRSCNMAISAIPQSMQYPPPPHPPTSAIWLPAQSGHSRNMALARMVVAPPPPLFCFRLTCPSCIGNARTCACMHVRTSMHASAPPSCYGWCNMATRAIWPPAQHGILRNMAAPPCHPLVAGGPSNLVVGHGTCGSARARVSVCVHACVRVRARACVCVCACERACVCAYCAFVFVIVLFLCM